MQARSGETWIVGAGGLGRVMSARLARTTHLGPSRLVTQREKSATALADGVHVAFPDGLVSVNPQVTAIQDLRSDASAPGVVILCLKGPDTEVVVQSIQRFFDDSTIVVTPQNGLHAFRLAHSLGEHRVIGAMLAFDGQCTGPRSAKQIRRAPKIRIGSPSGDRRSLETVRPIMERLAPTTIVDDLRAALWGKLVLNAATNAVSAIWNRTMREVLEDKRSLNTCVGLFREGLTVAKAAGVRLTSQDVGGLDPDVFGSAAMVDERSRSAFAQIHQDVLDIRSSMCRDLQDRRPTEVHWLNGEITRTGAIHGIPTPLHSATIRQIADLRSAPINCPEPSPAR